MNRTYLQCLRVLAAMTLATISVLSAQEPATSQLSLSDTKLQLDIARNDARKPLIELQDNFDKALERLADKAQKMGELDTVLEIAAERKNFRQRTGKPEPSSYEPLNKLRQIYERESAQIQNRIFAADKKLLSAFVTRMEAAVTELTRAGELKKALELREQIASAKKELEDPRSFAGTATAGSGYEELILGPGAKFEKDPRVTVTERGGLFALNSTAKDNSYVSGTRIFKTPFRILAKAQTDSKSMRIYFAQRGMVVFNWEVRPTELRIVEPVGKDRNGIPGGSGLDYKQMYEIEIRVSKSNVSVYVDGEKRGEAEGDFATAEGKVGIGPAFGGTVVVEYLKAVQQAKDSK